MTREATAGLAPATRGGIERLAQQLRTAKLLIGTSEELDATRLVLRLAETGRGGSDPAELRAALRPVFCKRSEEQATFDQVFDAWLDTLERAPAAPPPASPSLPASKPRRALPRWALVPLVLVPFALLVLVLTRPAVVPQPPLTPLATLDSGAVEDDPADAGGTTDAEPPPPARFWFHPAERANEELRSSWVFGGLVLVLLPLAFLRLPSSMLARRKRRSGRRVTLDTRRIELEATKLVPPLHTESAARLSRHLRAKAQDPRRLSRRPALDVRRTVEATERNLGVPVMRYRHALLRPSYLMLVDGNIERDPRARLFHEWVRRLMREGWDVEIRSFLQPPAQSPDQAPRAFRSESTGWSEARVVEMPLDHLEDPPAGQRLLVVSDGDAFVDAKNQVRPWVRRARLRRWRERVLFTPTQMRFWGAREEALEEPEGNSDPGLLVLPLDEPALDAWARLLATGRLTGFTLSEPERFPELLVGRTLEVLDEKPIADADELIAELKRYLGDTGFRWLSALAVPPLLRWDLTLLIGSCLVELQSTHAAGAALPRELEAERSALLSLNYRRLTQLPWLRGGLAANGSEIKPQIPNWLRLRLLHELPEAAAAQVREAVRRALSSAAPVAAARGTPLELELPPSGDATQRPVGEDDQRDTLYLGYMTGLSAQQLALRTPEQWSSWLRTLELPRRERGLRGALGSVIDRANAAWARLAFQDGVASLGQRQLTGWLALVGLVLWAGALALLAAKGPDALPKAARSVLFTTTERGAGVAGIRVLEVAFSPDSKRLHTVDENGTARTLDATTGIELAAWNGPPYVVRDALFSADTSRVAMRSDDTVDVWETATGRHLLAVTRPKGERVYELGVQMALSGTGSHLATLRDERVVVHDVAKGTQLLVLDRTNTFLIALDFSGERLAAVVDYQARVLDVRSGQMLLKSVTIPDLGYFQGGHDALTFASNGGLSIRYGSSSIAVDAKGSYTVNPAPTGQRSPDGALVASALLRHVAVFRPTANGLPDWSQELPVTFPELVRFSPDSSRLAITSRFDLSARLWLRSTEEVTTPPRALAPDLVQDALLAPGNFTIARPWLAASFLFVFLLLAWFVDRGRLALTLRRFERD